MNCCSEHVRIITRFKDFKNCLIGTRIFFLIAHMMILFLNIYYFGFRKMFRNIIRYLSYWGMVLNLLYYFSSLFTSTYTKAIKGILAQFNHFTFAVNYMITIVFFTVSLGLEAKNQFDYVRTVITHIVPFFSLVVEFSINNHVFIYSNLRHLLILFPVYIYVNIFFTILDGKPIYSQIDFRTLTGLFYAFLALLVCLFGALFGIWYQSIVKSWFFNYEYLGYEKDKEVKTETKGFRTNEEIQISSN